MTFGMCMQKVGGHDPSRKGSVVSGPAATMLRDAGRKRTFAPSRLNEARGAGEEDEKVFECSKPCFFVDRHGRGGGRVVPDVLGYPTQLPPRPQGARGGAIDRRPTGRRSVGGVRQVVPRGHAPATAGLRGDPRSYIPSADTCF